VFHLLDVEVSARPHLVVTGKTHFSVVVIIIQNAVYFFGALQSHSCHDDQHNAAFPAANNVSNEEDSGWGTRECYLSVTVSYESLPVQMVRADIIFRKC
jgi:hypothetical protein